MGTKKEKKKSICLISQCDHICIRQGDRMLLTDVWARILLKMNAMIAKEGSVSEVLLRNRGMTVKIKY